MAEDNKQSTKQEEIKERPAGQESAEYLQLETPEINEIENFLVRRTGNESVDPERAASQSEGSQLLKQLTLVIEEVKETAPLPDEPPGPKVSVEIQHEEPASCTPPLVEKDSEVESDESQAEVTLEQQLHQLSKHEEAVGDVKSNPVVIRQLPADTQSQKGKLNQQGPPVTHSEDTPNDEEGVRARISEDLESIHQMVGMDKAASQLPAQQNQVSLDELSPLMVKAKSQSRKKNRQGKKQKSRKRATEKADLASVYGQLKASKPRAISAMKVTTFEHQQPGSPLPKKNSIEELEHQFIEIQSQSQTGSGTAQAFNQTMHSPSDPSNELQSPLGGQVYLKSTIEIEVPSRRVSQSKQSFVQGSASGGDLETFLEVDKQIKTLNTSQTPSMANISPMPAPVPTSETQSTQQRPKHQAVPKRGEQLIDTNKVVILDSNFFGSAKKERQSQPKAASRASHRKSTSSQPRISLKSPKSIDQHCCQPLSNRGQQRSCSISPSKFNKERKLPTKPKWVQSPTFPKPSEAYKSDEIEIGIVNTLQRLQEKESQPAANGDSTRQNGHPNESIIDFGFSLQQSLTNTAKLQDSVLDASADSKKNGMFVHVDHSATQRSFRSGHDEEKISLIGRREKALSQATDPALSQFCEDGKRRSFFTIADSTYNLQRQETLRMRDQVFSNMQNRQGSITIQDLKKQLGSNSLTKKDRTERLGSFVDKLEKENRGYFKGKKVPFSKNQSYIQCVFNPFTSDGSVITLQLLGKRTRLGAKFDEDQMQDNLTRKMQMLGQQRHLRIARLVQNDAQLFEPPEDANNCLVSYGRLLKDDEAGQQDQNAVDQAVVSFWSRNSDLKQQVRKQYIIPHVLARNVNDENDLAEAIFLSENLNLPFIFSFSEAPTDEQHPSSQQIVLNLLGDPVEKIQLMSRQKTIKRTKSSMQNIVSVLLNEQVELKGLNSLLVSRASFLQLQVLAYLRNKPSLHQVTTSAKSSKFPQRAPTIVQVGGQTLLAITKTIDPGQKPSLCFVEVLSSRILAARRLTSTSSANSQEPHVIDGDVAYEVPGAEMFLRYERATNSIFYLTNRKLANPDNPCVDVAQARFSSPALVKSIDFADVVKLRTLKKEEPSDFKDQVRDVLARQKVWRLAGNQESIDFYRCYSIDYPYVEGQLTEDNSRLTLLLSGLETRCNVAQVFSLIVEGQQKSSLPPEAGQVQPHVTKPDDKQRTEQFNLDDNSSSSEDISSDCDLDLKDDHTPHHFEHLLKGWYKNQEDTQVGLSVIARLDCADKQELILEAEDSQKRKFDMSLEEVDTMWESVQFEFYEPFDPIKIESLDLDAKSTIGSCKGRMKGFPAKFEMLPCPDYQVEKEDDPDGYPHERSFRMRCHSETLSKKAIEVSWQGYCQHLPFSTRIFVEQTERSGNGKGEIVRKVVYESTTDALLCMKLKQVSLARKVTEIAPVQEFNVVFGQGQLLDPGLLACSTQTNPDTIGSVTLESAHKLIKTARKEVFVLHGSLKACQANLKLGKGQEYLSLMEIKPKSDTQAPKEDQNAQASDSGKGFRELQVPISDLIAKLAIGGEFWNENGLIYELQYVSEDNVKLVSVGYEFLKGAPIVNFFDFNLTKVQLEGFDELQDRKPSIQSPIPQNYIANYPIIAYKSFLSDNSEIVMSNLAHKKDAQSTVKLQGWQFVCFVYAAQMRELLGINCLDSHIIFIARHDQIEECRVFLISVDPWVAQETSENFGQVMALSTQRFKLPDAPLSQLKRVDLLMRVDDSHSLQLQLLFQFEESLWTVPLKVQKEPRQLLPFNSTQMEKRLGARNFNMEDSVFFACHDPENQESKILRVQVSSGEAGQVEIKTAFELEGSRFLALEMDPEDNNCMYYLDEDQRLVKLNISVENKITVDSVFDLSVHHIDELISYFDTAMPWASLVVDNRTLTIKNVTVSLMTNFKYSFAVESNQDPHRRNWNKSVGKRVERLLAAHAIPGSLFVLQVWKAGEYFYFRAKPLPGSPIVDCLGQWRTDGTCELFFASNEQVLINVGQERLLCFDCEGCIIPKNFPLYEQPHKVILESPIFGNVKFILIGFHNEDIALIKETSDGDPVVCIKPFSLKEVELELRDLSNSELRKAFGPKNQLTDEALAKVGNSMMLHSQHKCLTKFGSLILIASCVLEQAEESQVIFEARDIEGKKKKAAREDFVYEQSQKLFGLLKFGVCTIIVILCRSQSERSQLFGESSRTSDKSPVKKQETQRRGSNGHQSLIQQEFDENEYDQMPPNFCFAAIESKLMWVNYRQKRIWMLDVTLMDYNWDHMTENEEELSKPSTPAPMQVHWRFCECRSFTATSIFEGITLDDFEEYGIKIDEIGDNSPVRLRKINEPHDDLLELVQFTALNNALIFNLTSTAPYLVEQMQEIDQFRIPLHFGNTGFVFNTRYQTMQTNEDMTLGFIRPLLTTNSRGLYRAFSEIDLEHVVALKRSILDGEGNLTSKKMGEIEPLSVSCNFSKETFLSIFAEQGLIYEVLYEQLRQSLHNSEKQLLSPEALDLFLRRMRYVIVRPSPVFAKHSNQPLTRMSFLKQSVLFSDQKSRANIYRLAHLLELDITDYISCTADLRLVIQNLPSAQYFKMFDRFQENVFTRQVREAVMTKRSQLHSFTAQTSIVSRQQEEFGLNKDISDNQLLRKVQVRVIPLNWVYVNGKSLSTLFREFRIAQEKFQGSLLLDVMFDAFWSDFKWKIFGFCFLPYMVYFLTAFFYVTLMLYERDEEAEAWQFTQENLSYLDSYETPLRILLLLLWLFHTGVQVKQIHSDGLKSHFGQTQNKCDVLAYATILATLVLRWSMGQGGVSVATVRVVGAIAGLLLWFQLVFWLRLFDNTAQYVSLLLRTISDITSFMIMMIMIMFGFGTAFYVANLNRLYEGQSEEELLFPYQEGDYLFYASILKQYFIVLGDFEGINLNSESGARELLVTICFTLSTALSQITILNMLIAIMGDTFQTHMQEQDVKSKQQKLLLLSEYIDIVEFYLSRCCKCLKKQDPLFVVVVTPQLYGDDDEADQADEDQLQNLKRTIEQKFIKLESLLNKKLVKGLAQLTTETRARFLALQKETKTKVHTSQTLILSDTQQKQELQDQRVVELRRFLEDEILSSVKFGTKKLSEQLKTHGEILERFQRIY